MSRVAMPLHIDSQTRNTLEKLVHSSSTPQSLAMRSRIVLAAAAGSNNQQIASALRIPPITVGKWRRSFAIDGLEGLRDAPRSGRPPLHDAGTRHKVQTRVCQQPGDQGRWTVRTLAAEVGLPASTVHAMLVAAELQPHRFRTSTFSPDPDFEAKLLDIIGLYLNPPENALVLCVDEKSGIQALNRTQPERTQRASKTGASTNEYAGHSQTLLAALEVATGKDAAHVRDGRTSANFLSFMDDVVKAYPVSELRLVLDNLDIHKNEAAKNWLLSHPRVHFHYTATHASWLNMVECFFSIFKRQALKQGVHSSQKELREFLILYFKKCGENTTPFTWTRNPEHPQRIIEATREYRTAHSRKPKQQKVHG